MYRVVNISLNGSPNGFLPWRLTAEILDNYGVRGKEAARLYTTTEAQGFILKPTMNRQTQANLINKGLMNINQIFIMEVNQRVIIQM